MPRTAILIVAAGKGERAGGSTPKQYAPLFGQPMLRRSVEAFAGRRDTIVQVVIGPNQEAQFRAATVGPRSAPTGRWGRDTSGLRSSRT